MPKAKLTLSIGFVGAIQKDIIDIDDDDYLACETDNEREQLLNEYWKDWANDYIDGNIRLVDDGEIK